MQPQHNTMFLVLQDPFGFFRIYQLYVAYEVHQDSSSYIYTPFSATPTPGATPTGCPRLPSPEATAPSTHAAPLCNRPLSHVSHIGVAYTYSILYTCKSYLYSWYIFTHVNVLIRSYIHIFIPIFVFYTYLLHNIRVHCLYVFYFNPIYESCDSGSWTSSMTDSCWLKRTNTNIFIGGHYND